VNAPAGSTVHFTTNLLGSSTAQVTDLVYAPAVEIVLNPSSPNPTKKVISPAHGVTSADVTVPASGSVPFSYTTGSSAVGSGGVLGGLLDVLTGLADNFRAGTGIGAAVAAKWQGTIAVGGASNACSLQPQLPSVGITPTVPGVSLPPVNVPGLTPPAVSVPSVAVPGLPGARTGGSTSSQPGSGMQLNYKPTGASVADRVMPKGYGSGSGASSQYVAPGLNGSSLNAPAIPFKASNASTGSKPTAGPAKAAPSSVDVASNSSRSAITGLPALMVVLAVVALSAATAFYARTFLMHRPLLAKAPVAR
jgi:hypothetical protein